MIQVGTAQTRRATVQDAKAIHALLMNHSKNGALIARSLNEIYERIRSFVVIEEEGQVVGCCCLAVMWEDLAEIKSLAVIPECHGKGYGDALVRTILEDAKSIRIPKIFALTLIPEYFERFGFTRVDMNELPKKIWMECVNCVFYPDCCEIAVIRNVD